MTYYHFRVVRKSNRRDEIYMTDLSYEQMMQRAVIPYGEGRPIVAGGKTVTMDDLDRLMITKSEETAAQLGAQARAVARRSSVTVIGGRSYGWSGLDYGTDITDELIVGPPGNVATQGATQPASTSIAADARNVFVVHGRDEDNRRAMFDFLRALDLRPMEWESMVHELEAGSPYVGDVLKSGFTKAQAFVILLTPDEEAHPAAHLKEGGEESFARPRPNVIFEAGMALAFDESRTVLVQIGTIDNISDIAGRHIIRLDGSEDKRHALAQRLKKNAGCAVDDSGIDWKRAGNFVMR